MRARKLHPCKKVTDNRNDVLPKNPFSQPVCDLQVILVVDIYFCVDYMKKKTQSRRLNRNGFWPPAPAGREVVSCGLTFNGQWFSKKHRFLIRFIPIFLKVSRTESANRR